MADLKFTIGADAKPFERGLNETKRNARNFAKDTKKIIGKAFAFTAVIAGFRSLTQEMDRLGKLSRQGVSTDFLQDLSLQSNLSGTSLERTVRGITKFSREVNSASGPTARIAKEIEAIGLSVEDLQGKNPDELFAIIAETIGGLASESDQLAALTGIMGDRYSDLLPLLQDVYQNGGLADAPKVTEQAIKSTENFNDSITRISATLKNVFAPVIGVITGFIEVLMSALGFLGQVIGTVIFNGISNFQQFGKFIGTFLNTMKENFISVGKLIASVFSLDPSKIKSALNEVLDNAKSGFEELKNTPIVDLEQGKRSLKALQNDAQKRRLEMDKGFKLMGDSLGITKNDTEDEKKPKRERTGTRETDDTEDDDDDQNKAAKERLRQLKKERKGVVASMSDLLEEASNPSNMAVSSIQSIGGGGRAVGPDKDKLKEVAQKQLNKLDMINKNIDRLNSKFGLE